MSLGHHFQGQKVKGQLVADDFNSQHTGTGATWRMRRYCQLAGGGGILCRHAHSLLLGVLLSLYFFFCTSLSLHCMCCLYIVCVVYVLSFGVIKNNNRGGSRNLRKGGATSPFPSPPLLSPPLPFPLLLSPSLPSPSFSPPSPSP